LRYPATPRSSGRSASVRLMARKSSIDFVAFTFASLVTLAVALSTGWWYVFDWTVVVKFALLYIGMFAIAVGVPSYYLIRFVSAQKARQS
jgi:hypothetical protein